MSKMMTAEEAANYLGFKAATLAQYRWRGDGPPFRKLGKFVRYQRDDLDAWVLSRPRFTSTREVSAHAPNS
ncbi:helix-turn-helix domain-containing protein [Altericroceibacterium xinjiangense]|uniref:helix-turn-helix domain-containing protein n=1 Tax=Altericroceibacterium xinjiangense TaxID=762261 RepID=UPI000F7F4DA7|nr:helix-turn-helix domain-containing protein [Altericroceibacterium xinjiangense]